MASLVFCAGQMCFVYSAFSSERVEEVANRLPCFSHLHFKLIVCVLELWQPVDKPGVTPVWQTRHPHARRAIKIHCLTPFTAPSMQNVYFIQSLNGLPATAPSAFPSWALAAYCPGLLLGERCVGGRQMVRRSLGSFGSAHGSYVGAIKQKPCSIQADLNETVCLFV